MNSQRPRKNNVQLIWGIALMAMGGAVFLKTFRLPEIQGLSKTTATICLFLIGFILLGGGLKKILHYFAKSSSSLTPSDTDAE